MRSFNAMGINLPTDQLALAFKARMIKDGYEDVHLPHVVGRLSCEFCRACVPLRIVVPDFTFSENKRRLLKRNSDLEVAVSKAFFDVEEYSLYLRHYNARFKRQGDAPLNPDVYQLQKLSQTHNLTVRDRTSRKLLGMMFLEDFGDSIYAAGQIYDPAESEKRSLGHFGILSLVKYAQAQKRIQHIYLGSWVKDSDTVGYKQRYQPLEAKIGPGDKGWVKFDPEKHQEGFHPPALNQISIKLP
ncbi:MAG TPA: hypothetical protein VGD95_02460 [Micavibrio sp.]